MFKKISEAVAFCKYFQDPFTVPLLPLGIDSRKSYAVGHSSRALRPIYSDKTQLDVEWSFVVSL